ncbi:MAG TPA: VC_2705 family sodium/solute symporter [Geobacteraceae bacterium]
MNDSLVHLWPIVIVAAVLGSFILAGLAHKSREGSDYGFGGRYTGRIGGGAAIASNWMSAASFLGMAGLIYLKGYFALAYVIGWTGGYVLLLVLLAGQLRRFGKYTAPDFVGDRYDSSAARLLSALISIVISVIYCVAQFKGIGLLFAWLFGTNYATGLVIGVTAAVAYLIISGMLGVSRNQQMQYFVLIVSFIVPLMYLAYRFGYFWVLPQFGYGAAVDELAVEVRRNFISPFAAGSLFQWTALCFTLMLGTAGLPHILSRFYIVPNVREARWSVVWGLFFIALIYWSAPAYAVFARLLESRSGHLLSASATLGSADMVVIGTAVQGGLPVWLVGVLAAGAVSAAFFTVAGLLMSGAATLAHDIYYRLINPQVSETRKMAIAKGGILVLAALAFALALYTDGMIAEITAVAFALAGNTIFPVFLLGIWWGRATRQGAIAGMLIGVVITFAAPLVGEFLPFVGRMFPLTSSGLCGAPLVTAAIIVVSLLTPPPAEEMQRFLATEVHGHLD